MPSIEPRPAEAAGLAPIAPRILAKPTAAAYCGLTEAGFDDWVRRGLLPKAMKGTRRWDKAPLPKAAF